MTDGLDRLAVSYYAAPPSCSLESFCAQLARLGIGGVGLTARALRGRTIESVAGVLDANGLRCVSLNSAGYFLHTDTELARRQAELDARLLAAAAVLDAPVTMIPGGLDHAGGGLAPREASRRVRAGLERLAARAATEGARLALEAIHPLGVADKGCINQLSHARATVADLPSVGLVVDLFHSWWDADLDDTIANASADLFGVQICGVLTGSAGAPPRRAELAEGAVDVAGFVSQLVAAGYTGPFEYEVFHDAMPPGDLEGLLNRARADFVRVFAQAPA